MSEKPVIFISHATTDNPIVDIPKSQIEQVFANGVQVFASSVPGVIKPGRVWLDEIKDILAVARAVIVVITPVSINRPWIWFEVGASWSKMESGNRRIYPLCVPEIDFNDLPAPLNSLQALSLGKARDIRLFFQELCDELKFGSLKAFKASALTSRLPKYSELRINQNDLSGGAIYSGPYEGYSNSELEEVLIEDYLYREYSNFRGYKHNPLETQVLKELFPETSAPIVEPRNTLFRGRLIHYRELDENLKLPPGTAKRLLKKLAHTFGLLPLAEKDFENSVRFEYKPEIDTYRYQFN